MFEVLARLVVEADAEEYLVRYGAAPGAGGLELHQALAAGLEPAVLRTRLEQILAAAPKCLGLLCALSGEQLARLVRSRVE